MSREALHFQRIFEQTPDTTSGSNDIYFREHKVYKVLKKDAAVYQFCEDCSPSSIVVLLEHIKSCMETVFGDMILPTEYYVEQNKVVTKQALVAGTTLKELGQTSLLPDADALRAGIAQLRSSWSGDRELLGYIVEELHNPENVMFTGEKLIIIDWL